MINFESDILTCLDVLKRGGVILYPTDTVWGLGCDATNEQAIDRINALKQRPLGAPMIALVTEEQDILKHVAAPDLALFDYLKESEQPTTVIYDGAIGLADHLLGSDGSVALRICSDLFCRHLIKRFGKPIVSTSANRHGDPTPNCFSMITEPILQGADHIVQYRRGETLSTQVSTLIRWVDGTPYVLRP